jgi:hypothetical protein
LEGKEKREQEKLVLCRIISCDKVREEREKMSSEAAPAGQGRRYKL